MTLWLVVWLKVAWDCPFGLGKAPEAVKAMVCSKTQEKAWLITSSFKQAQTVVRDSEDSSPLVLELNGARGRKAAVVRSIE